MFRGQEGPTIHPHKVIMEFSNQGLEEQNWWEEYL